MRNIKTRPAIAKKPNTLELSPASCVSLQLQPSSVVIVGGGVAGNARTMMVTVSAAVCAPSLTVSSNASAAAFAAEGALNVGTAEVALDNITIPPAVCFHV